MKSFVEFIDEALTAQQRVKAKQNFRKNKAKIARGKEKAAKKFATPDKLKKKANIAARKALEKKLLKNRSKSDLSYAEREQLEKKLKSKTAVIQKLAKKMLPAITKADKSKMSSK